MERKRGQVWIETTIYTLIALVMIGVVLGYAKPKIQELQDRSVIDKTLEIMKTLDEQILSVGQGGAGNKRIINLEIQKGEIQINGESEKIVFLIKGTRSEYSEPNVHIPQGNIDVYTEKQGKESDVSLTLYYTGEDGYNLKYDGADDTKILTKSSIPYTLSISSKSGGIIDIIAD